LSIGSIGAIDLDMKRIDEPIDIDATIDGAVAALFAK
jgi:hypothetical protein